MTPAATITGVDGRSELAYVRAPSPDPIYPNDNATAASEQMLAAVPESMLEVARPRPRKRRSSWLGAESLLTLPMESQHDAPEKLLRAALAAVAAEEAAEIGVDGDDDLVDLEEDEEEEAPTVSTDMLSRQSRPAESESVPSCGA